MRKNKFGIELKKYLDFNKISINEFADRISITPKNLIDIINGKITISQNVIYNISFITEIPVNYIENVEQNYLLDNKIDEFLKERKINIKDYIKLFNYKELKDKYDVVYNNERNDYSVLKSILKYLRINDPNLLYKENNHIFYKSNNDKKELLALWLERCYKSVINQDIGTYNKDNIEKIVCFIRQQAKKNIFNKEELIKVFNKNGVYLAIEDDLKGAKIRGAFRVLNDIPAIYITLKHKRIADIYFALLHELAHCKSDFNRAKNGSIISYVDSVDSNNYEKNADNTALNWMVDNNIYKSIIDSHKYDYEIMSFLVYRLALDKIILYSSSIYQNNNKVINI